MKKVTAPQVATPAEAQGADLPESVQLALGELAGVAREGLLALSVGVGLGLVHGRARPRPRADGGGGRRRR